MATPERAHSGRVNLNHDCGPGFAQQRVPSKGNACSPGPWRPLDARRAALRGRLMAGARHHRATPGRHPLQPRYHLRHSLSRRHLVRWARMRASAPPGRALDCAATLHQAVFWHRRLCQNRRHDPRPRPRLRPPRSAPTATPADQMGTQRSCGRSLVRDLGWRGAVATDAQHPISRHSPAAA